MSLSRRGFVTSLGFGGASPNGALIAARGREALLGEAWPAEAEITVIPPPEPGEIRISSNENPRGPGDRALDALRRGFGQAQLYPSNSDPTSGDLRELLAKANNTEATFVSLGAGSGELLKNSVQAFVSKQRGLVTAAPTYGQPKRVATYLDAEIKEIPVDSRGYLDLDQMADASRGAGMIFVCNPNNPTGTVHSISDIRQFVEKVRRSSPDTVIQFDEAYHEYVRDPGYQSAAQLSLETPNVFITRTFSKVYGMAGLRIGYAIGHRDLMEKLRGYEQLFNTNTPAVVAAVETFQDEPRVKADVRRNTEAREFTVDFFRKAGYEVFDSHTNFIFVRLNRPARGFREGCAEHNVIVPRDFPPMEKTHARISIGTLNEMRRATQVFAEVLS